MENIKYKEISCKKNDIDNTTDLIKTIEAFCATCTECTHDCSHEGSEGNYTNDNNISEGTSYTPK